MANLTLTVPAVEKLLDYLASGTGAIAGPLLAPWRASREGKSRVIAAQADAEVRRIEATSEGGALQLIARAQAEARRYVVPREMEADGRVRIGPNDIQQWIEFQATKRVANVKSIADHAAELLGETEVRDHDPDPDWAARFFDIAQDVSSEHLQKLWARILAGEVETPGRTSLRTLSLLKNVSQPEAKQFEALMQYRIGNFIFLKGCRAVSGDRFEAAMVHLAHVGLLHSGWGPSPVVKLDPQGTWRTLHHGHMLTIEGTSGSQVKVTMEMILLTASGQELAGLGDHQPNLDYLAHFAGFLAKQGYVLKLAHVVESDPDRGFVSVSDTRVIEPWTERGTSGG